MSFRALLIAGAGARARTRLMQIAQTLADLEVGSLIWRPDSASPQAARNEASDGGDEPKRFTPNVIFTFDEESLVPASDLLRSFRRLAQPCLWFHDLTLPAGETHPKEVTHPGESAWYMASPQEIMTLLRQTDRTFTDDPNLAEQLYDALTLSDMSVIIDDASNGSDCADTCDRHFGQYGRRWFIAGVGGMAFEYDVSLIPAVERPTSSERRNDVVYGLLHEYSWRLERRPPLISRMSVKQSRVLHVIGPSGLAWTLARAQRRRGVHADTLSVGINKFNYRTDKAFPVASLKDMADLVKLAASSYDIFHFYPRPFFFNKKTLSFPTALDILALKAAGKRIIFYLTGSEARLHSVFRMSSPFHYVDEAPTAVTNFPEDAQRRMIALIRAIADRVVVSDAEMAGYVPGCQAIERAIDLSLWRYVGPVRKEKPLIVHAPSRQVIKGTHFVESAIRILRDEGLPFEFRLVENLSQREAAAIYRAADIVIDQVRIGWYGVLSVEAMALGKAVVCYIRDDLIGSFGAEGPPLAVANPNDLAAVVRQLIVSPALRDELGSKARRYVERVHDADLIAGLFLDVYQEAIDQPTPLDIAPLADLLLQQEQFADTNLMRLVNRLTQLTHSQDR